MRGSQAALALGLGVLSGLTLTGCITVGSVLRTDALIPQERPGEEPKDLQFPVRLDRFTDDRSDRSSVGYFAMQHITTDRDIVEVFEKIAIAALDRKGIRRGPSVFAIKGTVRQAFASSLSGEFKGANLNGKVSLQLDLVNVKTQARLWSKSYGGVSDGRDFQTVLARAFQDLQTALDRDDSILALKPAYIAASGQAPGGPAPTTAAPAAAPEIVSDVDRVKKSGRRRPDDYAMIVGIEKYQTVPDAQYAERDAAAFKSYVEAALGVPEENTIFLTGQRATRTGISKYLEEWLPRNVGENSRVYFFYSGHGSPDPSKGTAYLVPWDGDPGFLQSSAYPVSRLYEMLQALKAKEVIVALDSCFSGAKGRSVLAKGARPLVNVIETEAPAGSKLSILTASSGDEITGGLDDQGHGMFTYYLLKGLQGEAAGQDGGVALDKLFSYVQENVRRSARRQNREQTPQLLAPARGLKLY